MWNAAPVPRFRYVARKDCSSAKILCALSPTAIFALALEEIDGIGWVTANRLLKHFESYDDLRRYPREQVLVRIKGVANAEALVHRLFDGDAMEEALAAARAEAEQLQKKRIALLTPRSDTWPTGLDDLSLDQRPFLLHAFGHASILQQPIAALFARPPLDPAPFETAQALVRQLLRHEVVPATGAANGFDVVVHKIAGSDPTSAPSLLVAHEGLAKVPRQVRPAASGAVRSGGLLLSPFPMQHGPFDHDDRTRALVLAALSNACVFVAPRPDTPEWKALEWALDAERPTFVLSAEDEIDLPEGARPIKGPSDFDRVVAAATEKGGDERERG